MNKQDFLAALKGRLAGIPESDLNERLDFYAEMIDDRIEDGLSEEEAVNEIGSVDEIVEQLLGEYPLAKIVKEKVKPKHRLTAWEIILIVLGSPLWLTFLGVVLTAVIAFIGVLLSIAAVFWCLDIGLVGAFALGIAASVLFAVRGDILTAVFGFGCSLVSAGLSIPVFFLSKAITKGMWLLLKKSALKIKSVFVGKEDKR